MDFLAATNNAHKLNEIRRILHAMGHKVFSLQEVGLSIEPEETGDTFAQNALIKARAVCKASGWPTIADDSGLMVDALDGAPGVYSARFAGEEHDDVANNAKLLHLLRDVPLEKRTARFVSAIALAMPEGAVWEADGACEGVIGFKAAGENGFGYDPLFYVDGLSFAQMTAEQKDSMSHRAKALQKFAEWLPNFLESVRG